MKGKESIQDQIEKRINSFERGAAFSAFDFLDIAEANTVNQMLYRLEKSETIRRLLNGIYDKPTYSNLIKEYSAPRIDKVAEALARRFNWRIAPSGNTALNLLHVSTQVPNVWEYVSDGPYREYDIDGTKLKFKHTKAREINGYSQKTIMTIQAIRALGRNKLTNEDIRRLSSALTSEEKRKMPEEARSASGWVYDEIKNICVGEKV